MKIRTHSKNKKWIQFLTISLMILFASCTNPDEKIVKDYLQENLNDPTSYEPIKFVSGDSLVINLIPEIENQRSLVETTFQRRSKLINDLLKMAKNLVPLEISTSLISTQSKIAQLKPLDYSNLYDYKALQDKLTEAIGKTEPYLKKTDRIEIWELIASIEGSEHRINSEVKRMIEISNLYELGPSSAKKKHILIYHKFRAKNNFGALVLNENVFIVDSNLKQVVKTIKK